MPPDRLLACITFVGSVYLAIWGLHGAGAIVLGMGVLGIFASYPLAAWPWDEGEPFDDEGVDVLEGHGG